MLVHQKTTLGRCYCIKSFCSLKTLEKCFEKLYFCITYNSAQKHDGFIGFKNACSRAKTYVILTSLDGPECVYVPKKKRASTARELPD